MSIHSRPGSRGVAVLGLVAFMAVACSGGATSNSTGGGTAPAQFQAAATKAAFIALGRL